MKIRIYQINLERDEDRIAFQDLENLSWFQQSADINCAIYDRVYEGDVDCTTLEDVFRKFNLEHPPEHMGRSLSVSDIVEVVQDPHPLHQNQPPGRRLACQDLEPRRVGRQRLFAEDVLPRLQGVERLTVVRDVRRGDIDRFDARIGKKPLPRGGVIGDPALLGVALPGCFLA